MPNRSVRASLILLNDLLSQLAYTFVSLVVTPLIVANLGTEIFGAWKSIEKIRDILPLGNLEPLGLLELTLAKDIGNENFTYKQQQLGSAISILLLTLPIMLILSFLLFHFKNIIIPVSKEITQQVDLALLFISIFVILSGFLQIPNSVIRGVNMQYKMLGVNSIATVITALLTYLVVAQGCTLPWIAVISTLPPFASALISSVIVIKYIPWFKFVKPRKEIMLSFLRMDLWALSTNLFRRIFNSADLILIGIYFGMTATAVYSLTRALITFLFTPVKSFIRSVLAGIGDLVGRKEIGTLLQLRSEQINMVMFLGFIIGTIVMFFNASFVALWIDEKHFGGESLSRWIIVATLIDFLTKIDANYFDASLKLKYQTLALGSSAIVYLVIIVLCEKILGLNVFPIAQIVSQVILMLLYWIGLKDFLRIKFTDFVRTVLRPLFITSILLYFSLWVKLPVIHNWIELFIQAFGVTILAGLLSWFLILKKNDRKNLSIRLLRAIGK